MATPPNEPPAPAGDGPAPARTGRPPAPVNTGTPAAPVVPPDALTPLQLNEAEIDEWAERERQRREEWLRGPTAEERAAWAQQERERRLARLRAPSATEASESGRLGAHYLREAQLAAEGAVRLVWKEVAAEGAMGAFRKWSRRGLDTLVRAGREWEEEAAQPGPRRPVPLDEQAP
jgi:hypothetical protein